MSKYLLDTDICVYYLRGKFNMRDKVKQIGKSNCYISEITIAELTYGAVKSLNFQKHKADIVTIEHLFSIVPIYQSFAKYAEERVRLQKSGLLIPNFDLLIGTTAVVNNMTMVTNNEKHLSRINGIKIENWTKAKYNKFVTP